MTDRVKDFEKELKELLKKYDAEIEIEQCGYYGECAEIVVNFSGCYKGELKDWVEYKTVNFGRYIDGENK